MLSHYWTADDHPATRRAQAEDWLDDLAEFTAAEVKIACADWRRHGTRRPLISEIRSRCAEARQRQERRQSQPAWDREAFAREAGFATWAEREAAIDRQQDRYRKGEEWRNSEQGREWAAKRPHFGGKND